MRISEIMTSDPEFCLPDDTILEVAKRMERNDVGIIPICESRDTRRLVGCLTDRDLVIRVVAAGDDPASSTAGSVMSDDLVICTPSDEVGLAVRLMKDNQLHRVLVVDENGSLAGLVSLADVARALEVAALGEVLTSISRPGAVPSGV